ncbi:metallo-beta-lactamase family protein [Lysinibacillus capsici]|uniref:Metallo-beta-lactamase family protein n=1 Tax=Lysinibacillus capsici TaxID=2115968 RepID=A0A2X0XKG7_9BACI|nr:MBL fold metallo-hydrolase [Lysinibacillus capsici]SPT98366.1 metallo-beta-lactamase family protein [Lysinibacillus capsici]
MIQIKTLATGSKGNCYHITDGSTPLLLECGISFKDIQKGVNFETSCLGGVLVTHEHKDHCKGVESVLNRGLDVYMSQGTREALSLDHHRIKTVKSKDQFRVGTWTVLPFDVQHDVNEPLGFLLQSDNGGKLLFATDTYYVKYRFKDLTHIMIECNYDQQTLDENVDSGRIHPAMKKRVMRSHFSLENLLEFFKANDLSKVEEIHLLHLSDSNSNMERIFKAVARATGKMIYIP